MAFVSSVSCTHAAARTCLMGKADVVREQDRLAALQGFSRGGRQGARRVLDLNSSLREDVDDRQARGSDQEDVSGALSGTSFDNELTG